MVIGSTDDLVEAVKAAIGNMVATVARDNVRDAIVDCPYAVSKGGVKSLSFAECVDVFKTNNDID